MLGYTHLFSAVRSNPLWFICMMVSYIVLAFPMVRLHEAHQILTDAAEDYENSTSGGEDTLHNAGARASRVLALRNIWSNRHTESPAPDPPVS
jgi:hypothetical protein